jgi:hypothetical protein
VTSQQSALSARCDDESLHVTLVDCGTFSTPLWWYPRLLGATGAARNNIEFMPMGLHWPEIDEDISIASMLRGAKAPGARPQ